MNPSSTSRVLSSLAAAVAALPVIGCSSTGSAPPEPTSVPQPQPRVLFQGQGTTHLLVGVANLDGSNITYPLSDLPGGDQTNPDWSPDGSRMVFVVDDGARDDLWIADADGSDPELLLDCAAQCTWLDDPDWSPNGARIVYSRGTTLRNVGSGSLEAVDVATGEVQVIVPAIPRRFMAGARWSPHGSEVVYESVHTAGPGLDSEVDGVSLRIVAVGTNVVGPPLTDPDLFAATADWSPDGTTIVYSALARPDSEASDVFVISPEGGEPRQLTNLGDAGGYAEEPAWRGDSNTIVFSGRLTDRAGSGELLTVSADGGSSPVGIGAAPVIGRHPRVEPGA